MIWLADLCKLLLLCQCPKVKLWCDPSSESGSLLLTYAVTLSEKPVYNIASFLLLYFAVVRLLLWERRRHNGLFPPPQAEGSPLVSCTRNNLFIAFAVTFRTFVSNLSLHNSENLHKCFGFVTDNVLTLANAIPYVIKLGIAILPAWHFAQFSASFYYHCDCYCLYLY